MSCRVRAALATLVAALLCACAAPLAAPAQQAPGAPDVPAPGAPGSDAPTLNLSGSSGIVVEASTGQVAYEKDADERRPIASTTKLMTALLALEELDLRDRLPAASYRPAPVESQMGLRPGERLTVADLLRGLLIVSGNDAAVTLAEGVSGSRKAFARAMNRRAKELGLRNTRYANAIGLDAEGAYSSARDLVTLARRLRRFAFFRRTTDRQVATTTSGDRARTLRNRNLLLGRSASIDGVKTGRTQKAGFVLVASETRRPRGLTMVSAILGTPSEADRLRDSSRLLGVGFATFSRRTAVRRGDRLGAADLEYRDGARVGLTAGRTIRRVVQRGQKLTTRVLRAPEVVDGPLARGARVGEVEVRLDGRRIAVVPLVTESAVAEAGFAQKLEHHLSRPLVLVLLAVLLLALVQLVVFRRRFLRRAEARRARPSDMEPA